MEFTSNRYLITEIVRPKSLFVTDIKAKVGDELEFVIQVELRKNSRGPVYSSQITVKNLSNGKRKQFVQQHLSNYLDSYSTVLKMREIY